MLPSEKRFIDAVLAAGTHIPKELIGHQPSTLVKSLRKRLRMTQRQLGKRVGLPQSYIAKIESGKKKPTLETLEKIFRGLHCSLALLLCPEHQSDEILDKQAHEAAQKKVRYVAGTMTLEQQLPSKDSLKQMIEEEKKKLLDLYSSRVD